MLGSKSIPAIGFAGMERIILEMKEAKSRIPSWPQYKLFLVQLGDLAKRKALRFWKNLEKRVF